MLTTLWLLNKTLMSYSGSSMRTSTDFHWRKIQSHFLFFFLGLEEIIAENTRPTVDGGYFCIICAKVLKGPQTNVRSHFVDLHWSDAPSYWCYGKQCHKYYTSKSAFRKHLRNYHPDWKGVSLDTFIVKKWKHGISRISKAIEILFQ